VLANNLIFLQQSAISFPVAAAAEEEKIHMQQGITRRRRT
jgi:hypothetical protein